MATVVDKRREIQRRDQHGMISPRSESAAGIAARAAANRALTACLRRKRPLDAVLYETVTGLSSRDGGFARAIASETMRRFGQIDDLLRHFVPEPPSPHRAGSTVEILLSG